MWHAFTTQEVADKLRSHPESGLSEAEAQRRLATNGPNALPEPIPPSRLALFASQFKSPIIWALIGAAVVSGLLQEWIDAGAILAIVLLNAALGFFQEFRAERSLAALQKLTVTTARILRDGEPRSISASELVVGDLIQVEAGDHVPADARLIYATGLHTQEAALTGESTPVDKTATPLPGETIPIAERHNMLLSGTDVTAGKGRALVIVTGLQTELGHIAALIQAAGTEETPLQRRLEQLGHVLLYLSVGIVSLVFLLGLLRGEPFFAMFLTAVSLAVAAVPEGLPAIVTRTLALGVTRMVRRNALIRRLPAVETLGSTTVICTDKTGTLTKNEMTVTQLFTGGRSFEVSGEGYAPRGEIRPAHRPDSTQCSDYVDNLADNLADSVPDNVYGLLTAAVLCNGALLQEEHDTWRIMGDPTEGALLVVAAKARLYQQQLEVQYPVIGEVPFDPQRKMMTVVRRASQGPIAYVKGAPDVLLQHCTQHLTGEGNVTSLTQSDREEILSVNAAFAHKALRVLGVACRSLTQTPTQFSAAGLEQSLTFLGLLAMQDPLRPEAKTAVATCHEAGILIVMITGDHNETARAIAQELGLLSAQAQALSGTELDQLTDVELAQRIDHIAVYARVSAEHKLRIVKAWKDRSAIVAMTGDGINDAPAIKEADIGVAMGITGTDVTKEAADMVVTDDNFASIAAAVEEGRGIYANIRKAVHYLLSCNLSEILLMLLATVCLLPLPLLPVQILWINLVTDGLPALALCVDPSDPGLMQVPPRPAQERFLTNQRMQIMFAQGILLALSSLGVFVYSVYGMGHDIHTARTLTFSALVMLQLFHAFNCRNDTLSLFTLGIATNKPLLWAVVGSGVLHVGIIVSPWTRDIFHVVPLELRDWLLVCCIGVLPLVAMETLKTAWSRNKKKTLMACVAK